MWQVVVTREACGLSAINMYLLGSPCLAGSRMFSLLHHWRVALQRQTGTLKCTDVQGPAAATGDVATAAGDLQGAKGDVAVAAGDVQGPAAAQAARMHLWSGGVMLQVP